MQVFLVLRIIKCMLEASLCHFSYLSWIWQSYTKYPPLGNYIFHLSTQKKVLCFQLSHLQSFYMFQTQSQYISLLLVIYEVPISTSHDKGRRQSKSGWMILRGEMPCWFIRKVKHILCFLQACFPLLLCCWWRWRICTCWRLKSFTYLQTTAPFV